MIFTPICDGCGKLCEYAASGGQIHFCNKCRERKTILFEGMQVVVNQDEEIQVGDTYLAKRNVGWKMLTCKENNKTSGFIVPVENAYYYDTWECFKVIEL